MGTGRSQRSEGSLFVVPSGQPRATMRPVTTVSTGRGHAGHAGALEVDADDKAAGGVQPDASAGDARETEEDGIMRLLRCDRPREVRLLSGRDAELRPC